ncbi:hypothetical protein B9Z65_4264 [Elsinoe australis]|uniref:Uncharacterized protein n=1 Tax=Elsinoe australis TaxID=40998 RepID=A0A2P7Z2A4_9PEZI|nr:hypothetical protein B9Z65_4264 [Elsinoe australis]
MKATNEFRSDFYHKWLLMPILIGQFGVILINLFYCAIAIGLAIHRAWHGMSWDWEAFYPLRTILTAVLAISLLSALIITLLEGIRLLRHRLRPGKFLLSEILKVPIWLLWMNVAGLSFFNIIEKGNLSFGIVALAIHALGFCILFIPIPYAALLYVRDRRGYFGVQNTGGWGYENGSWVPPEKVDEHGDDQGTTEGDDTEPSMDEAGEEDETQENTPRTT